MNGYEIAALLRVKVTIANAMQAADKLEELENQLKQKTGKKNESKPSSNKDKTSFFAQRKAPDSDGSAIDSSRVESQPDLNESLLSDAGALGDKGSD